MNKHKWTIIAGAVTAAIVLLVGLGFGAHALFAQGPDPNTTPTVPRGPNGNGLCGAVGVGCAAGFGWQVHGEVDLIAQTLGMTTDDLTAELQSGKSVAQVAEEKGVALDTVVNAIINDREAALNEAVADGRITQEQADTMLANMQQNIPERLQQPFNLSQMGPAGRMWNAQGMGWNARGQVDLIAQTLGMTTDDLIAELQSGKSVAQVAEDKGVALNTVVTALVDERQATLDEAVANGRITQEQADTMLANFQQNVTQRLQQTWSFGQGMGPGMMNRGQGLGPGIGGQGTGRGIGGRGAGGCGMWSGTIPGNNGGADQ